SVNRSILEGYRINRRQGRCVASQLLGRVQHFTRQYGALYIADALSWAAAIIVALILRYDFDVAEINWVSTVIVIVFIVALQLVGGWVFWLYRNRFEIGSFDEVRAVVFSVTSVAIVSGLVAFFVGYGRG